MKTLLFVDDEPNVLQGLQRQLRSLRAESFSPAGDVRNKKRVGHGKFLPFKPVYHVK